MKSRRNVLASFKACGFSGSDIIIVTPHIYICVSSGVDNKNRRPAGLDCPPRYFAPFLSPSLACERCRRCVHMMCECVFGVFVCIFSIIFPDPMQCRDTTFSTMTRTTIVKRIVWPYGRFGGALEIVSVSSVPCVKKCYCVKWVNCAGSLCAMYTYAVAVSYPTTTYGIWRVRLWFECGADERRRNKN